MHHTVPLCGWHSVLLGEEPAPLIRNVVDGSAEVYSSLSRRKITLSRRRVLAFVCHHRTDCAIASSISIHLHAVLLLAEACSVVIGLLRGQR